MAKRIIPPDGLLPLVNSNVWRISANHSDFSKNISYDCQAYTIELAL